MSPTVPSGPCSTTSTTAWWKFGSSSDGLATKSTPFPTDDGDNSFPARAGTACRTVRSPPSRKLAMTFRAPTEPSERRHSDGGNMRELPDSKTLNAYPFTSPAHYVGGFCVGPLAQGTLNEE